MALATTLIELFKPALRIAGITMLPGIGPSTDQTGELIPAINRLVGMFNLDGLKIFNTSIDRYALTPLQSSYFIGPSGDFQAPRPNYIHGANVVITSASPELHLPIHMMTPAEWEAMTITELPMAWPIAMYNDGANPDSKLYLYGFPTNANDLELFTWQALKNDFTAISDAVYLPDGYEAAIVDSLALEVARLHPRDTVLRGEALVEARRAAQNSLQAVMVLNTECPRLHSEAANIGGRGSGLVSAADWRSAPWYR